MSLRKYVIILGGGQGLRMGAERPKQFLLLQEKPVLMHSIEAFYQYDPQIRIVVVLPEEQKEYWQSLCSEHRFAIRHRVIGGGRTRFHSVQNGLQDIDEGALVAIHDGVRPLVTQQIISEAFDVAATGRSVYPALPVSDTLRRRVPNRNCRTVDRSHFFLAQTPQVFPSRTILQAYRTDYSPEYTDDISVVERRRTGRSIMIDGSPENLKITTPIDLIIAEALLKCRK
ncbi:MAG: 2-C-methyl-D-erythritol 4-phosphate cytidylyltransferase [Dysgonamonadaceae bacterium]|jgi:2-C-methyl-D-erythritol 4-phosphate cytidylyltransferase|nr:2-C-methyl-D-erythritol 4-phosphate cytidylyltransferase [Dysgonamonadaceae bacterium]